LLGQGLIGAEELQEMEAKINGIVEDAVRFAEESPYPGLEEALEDVFVQ
jgi:pyruvate dehydrogenase E1 component alpha subunit